MTTLIKIIVATIISLSLFSCNYNKNDYEVKESLKTVNSSISASVKQE